MLIFPVVIIINQYLVYVTLFLEVYFISASIVSPRRLK